MSVLVYINSNNGLHKSAFEAVTYGKKLGGDVTVITSGAADATALASLGKYGASKVLVDRSLQGDDDQQLTRIIASATAATNASTLIFSHDLTAKAVAPRLSVRLKAGLVSGATEVPNADGTVKVNVFSGKAFSSVKVNSTAKIISLLPNSIQPEETGSDCAVEEFNGNAGESKVKVLSTKKPEGEIPLPDVVEQKRDIVDISARFPLWNNLSVRMDIKNILDAPYQLLQGNIVRESYTVGRGFNVGFNWKP